MDGITVKVNKRIIMSNSFFIGLAFSKGKHSCQTHSYDMYNIFSFYHCYQDTTKLADNKGDC